MTTDRTDDAQEHPSASSRSLAGTSRTVLTFMVQRWPDLIEVLALPSLGLITGLAIVGGTVGGLAPSDAAAPLGAPEDVVRAALGLMVGMVAWMVLGNISMYWAYVRLNRLYLMEERGWIGDMRTVAWSCLLVLAYGMLFTLAWLFSTLLVEAVGGAGIWLVALASGALTEDPQPLSNALLGAFGFGFFAYFLVSGWVWSRFLVGMPAVAIGRRPHVVNDMWSLSGGRSWGVPLRLAGSLFVLQGILAGFVVGLAASPLAASLQAGILSPTAAAIVVAPLVLAPALWMVFASLFLAEAWRRLTGHPRADRVGGDLLAA